MDKKRRLTEQELNYYADNLSEISEDGCEMDEDDFSDIDHYEDTDVLCLQEETIPEDDVFDIENMPIMLLPMLENGALTEMSSKPSPRLLQENGGSNVPLDMGTEYDDDSEVIPGVNNNINASIAATSTPRTMRKRKNYSNKENIPDKIMNNQKNKTKDTKEQKEELKKMLSALSWRRGNLVLREASTAFKGSEQLPKYIEDLETPYDFFRYFFDKTLIELIVTQSNLFSSQTFPHAPFILQQIDVQKYLGICILMSVIHLPNVRNYWSSCIGVDIIKEAMSQKTFEKIRRTLHFNDNTTMLPREHEEHDRLHKIRPILNYLLHRFKTIPYEESLSVDEQMCATKAKTFLRQYMPAKPHKWGYKLFVLSGVSGYVYNFEVYTGQEKQLTEIDLGACANIVIRLLCDLPKQLNHRVYFDNFYTTIPLVVQLAEQGILSLGTVRRNRIPNCPLPTEADMKTDSRGMSYEFVSEMNGVPFCLVTWKDNKSVNLLSTYVGTLPKQKIKRYDKKEKGRIEIDCPTIIKDYNKHMGGVDLVDSLIGRYRIRIKSKKWYFRLFYHILDMTMVNAWILYKKNNEQKNIKKTLGLADFRIEVGQSLCMMGVRDENKRGRKSDLERILDDRQRKSGSSIPPKDIRTDGCSHWPQWMEKRLRCKIPSCTGFTYVQCQKCCTALCLNKDRNCLKNFHI